MGGVLPAESNISMAGTGILGRNTSGAGKSARLSAAQVRTLCSVYSTSEVDTLLSAKANSATTLSGYGITNAYTKTEVDNLVAGLLDFKGNLDCSTNPNYPSASKGDAYYCSVAGKVGGASGASVDVGDMIVASADNAGGTQASVGTSWFVLEHNLAGALVASNNLSDLASAATARTNLGLGTLATQSGTFSGTSSGTNTGDQTITLTGDVTGSGAGSFAATISANAVTFAKFVAAGSAGFVGATAAGNYSHRTPTQVTAALDVAVGDSGTGGTKGLVPAPAAGDASKYLRGDMTYQTVSGLSGTGSVDNAVLRADGTGGSTLQSSAIVIDDLYTSSPNATVNYVCMRPTGGTTNVGVAVAPKGTGPFSLQVPDGTTTGGNARGANAIDLQTLRSAADQVASGASSFVAGERNKATGSRAVAIGYANVASGNFSCAVNYNCTASGQQAFAACQSTVSGNFSAGFGQSVSVSANNAFGFGEGGSVSAVYAFASGFYPVADRRGMEARATTYFIAGGDTQRISFNLHAKTTNATPTTMYLDTGTTRLTIPSGKVMGFTLQVLGVKSDGSAISMYRRLLILKNVGGTTTLVNSQSLGSDYEDNSSTDIAITADDTNDAVQINVTGIAAETWRWQGVIFGGELAYGT